MPRLTVHRRQKRLYDYDLSSSQIVVVGHEPTNDIVLRDRSRRVSRHHAALMPRASDGRYFVRDLKSLRGTNVAGRPIDRQLLRDGDVVEIGDYAIVFSELRAVASANDRLVLVPHTPGASTESPDGPRRWPNGNALAPQRVELLEHFSRTGTRGADVHDVLETIGPILVKIMQADRGFIRVFSEGDGPDQDLAVTGLNAGEAIRIAEGAFLERLLAGRYVRDGSTLLVPIMSEHRTIGFFCFDRQRPPRSFTDEEGHFLIGIGQAAMTLSDAPTWDTHIVGRSSAIVDVHQRIRDAAACGDDVLFVGEPGSGKRLAARALKQYGWRCGAQPSKTVNVRRIALPPLRDRREDIPLLAFYFLDRCADARRAHTRTISRPALQKLLDYDWPGNVRELESTIINAVTRNNEVIFSWDLDLPARPRRETTLGNRNVRTKANETNPSMFRPRRA